MSNQFEQATKINKQKYLIQLSAYYPEPTESDYNRGWFYRYFVRKTSDPIAKVIEINKKQWSIIQKNPFYTTVQLEWYITMSPFIDDETDGSVVRNRKSIRVGMNTISNLNLALPNLLQFHKNKGRLHTGFILPWGYRIDEFGHVVREYDSVVIGRSIKK